MNFGHIVTILLKNCWNTRKLFINIKQTMEQQIPKTKEEAFALLDAMLNDDEKKTIMEKDDVFFIHFSFGAWIRNNWIYPLNEKERESFLRMFEEDEESRKYLFFYHPDSMTSFIIDKYTEYLKNLNDK